MVVIVVCCCVLLCVVVLIVRGVACCWLLVVVWFVCWSLTVVGCGLLDANRWWLLVLLLVVCCWLLLCVPRCPLFVSLSVIWCVLLVVGLPMFVVVDRWLLVVCWLLVAVGCVLCAVSWLLRIDGYC